MKNTKKLKKARNFHKLAHLRGEISLSTKSESLKTKKFSRKEKHKRKDD